MRGRLVAALVIIFVGAVAIAGWRLWASYQTAPQAPVASTTAPIASITPALAQIPATETPTESTSPLPSFSPVASLSPSALLAPSPPPTATPTIPPEPAGLAPGWADMTERTSGGPEADLVVRTGDINNLGFGWPPNFTPFSGKSTPPHPYPCTPRPGAAPGTDRIMLGSGVTAEDIKKGGGDGYSSCSTRPDNLPQAIPLVVGALPNTIHEVFFQMFLDDFQAPVWGSHFQVTLNGTRIPSFEDTINLMDQTGPIGKLVTLRLLPEYWPLLRTGTVQLLIDDPTTHKLDGYAVDFVRILVNPHGFRYVVAIACTVVDNATQKPIAGASVSAAQDTVATTSAGMCSLRGVPAGLVSVSASAIGYDSQVQLLDLPAGTNGTAHFALKRHSESVSDLQRSIQRNGSVEIYGIHFDTASAQLRPDSLASLEQVLRLITSSRNSRWIIAGHTDNQGGAAYNLALSLARAKSVVAWLNKHGVSANRLNAKGYGFTRPVADNATAAGRALNRRVEVSLVR